MARNFAQWLKTSDRSRPAGFGEGKHCKIPDVLSRGELQVVYQPLVDFENQSVFAYEALVRSNSPAYTGPPALFTEAIAANCCGALGGAIREMAVEECSGWPLFLNIHPNEFDEGWLVRPDDPIFQHDADVYLEITESVPLSHFDFCRSVLNEIRGRGIYLAVDDLGAGYSNLKYIADLSPEIVKLDRGLVVNLPVDVRLQKLVRAIVRLCGDLGARVVAEGIERPEEAMAVRLAGVRYGQGYIFAKPSYPPPPPDRVRLDVLAV